MNEFAQAIRALERMRDDDRYLTLDKHQTNNLMLLLWAIVDGGDVRSNAADLLGVLVGEKETA